MRGVREIHQKRGESFADDVHREPLLHGGAGVSANEASVACEGAPEGLRKGRDAVRLTKEPWCDFTLSPIGDRGRSGSTSRICCVAPIGRAGRSRTRRSGTSRTCRGAGRAGPRGAARRAGRGLSDAFAIERSLPAGHVNAALAMARRLELARLLDRSPSRERDLVLAMICQRVIAPARSSGPPRVRPVDACAELGVEDADEDELYAAMDWLVERQARIEDRLAAGTWRRRAGALRPFLVLLRGPLLPAGGVGVLARR